MNVIFMGTPDFAVPTLQILIEHHYQIQAVVTQPDRAKGRGKSVIAPPVKRLAQEQNLLCLQPEKIRDAAMLERLREFAPDVMVVVAYGQILPEAILQIPRFGCINVHASLLPKYRGAAPIHWAILRGESETGITTMFMDKGMDTGDMLLRRTISIASEDTAGTLHDRLAPLGARLLIETLQQLEKGTLQRISQDSEAVTYAPLLKKEDGALSWGDSAATIERKVRGLYPWPGTYTSFQGRMIKLLHVAQEICPPEAKNFSPGTIIGIDPQSGPLVATGQECIRILKIQPQNKKPMKCSDFCRGYRLIVGDRLGCTEKE